MNDTTTRPGTRRPRTGRPGTGRPGGGRSTGRRGGGGIAGWWRPGGSGRPDRAPAERPGWFDPPSVLVCPAQVRVGGTWTATLTVSGFPREVGPAWLSPLIGHPGLTDVSVHLTPLAAEVSATRLRRRLARLESGRRIGAVRGELEDADVDASAEDAHVLMAQIARGVTRLFETTVTVTVHAGSRAALAEEVASVRSVAASLMIGVRATTWRSLHAWHTGLPTGLDRLETGRILDTATLASSFPFAAADLPATRPDPHAGILLGTNLGSASLVWWDRWKRENYNEVILGASGSGKSWAAKASLLRQLYTGVEAQVIDPDNEYVRLADSIGGTVIRLGEPGVKINPLELPVFHDPITGRRLAASDALARRRLALQSFLAVALTGAPESGDTAPASGTTSAALSALERSVLDTAITTAYLERGITDDPRTWTRPAPLLADLHAALIRAAHPDQYRPEQEHDSGTRADSGASSDSGDSGDAGESGDAAGDCAAGEPAAVGPTGSAPDDAGVPAVAAGLAARLDPYVHGSWGHLFDGPTTSPPSGPLVVWSLSELPEQMRAVAMVLVLDAVWRSVAQQPQARPRLVVIDEAWQMLAHPSAARFLLRAAKSLRKQWAGLTLITQDVADVLSTDLGRAVVSNSATAVLLRQAPQALPDLTRTFALSAGESRFLQTAKLGEALLVSGSDRVALRAVASAAEDAVITTDPRQLAAAPDGRRAPQWVDLDHPAPRPAAAPPPRPSAPTAVPHRPPGRGTPGGSESPDRAGGSDPAGDFDDLAVPGW